MYDSLIDSSKGYSMKEVISSHFNIEHIEWERVQLIVDIRIDVPHREEYTFHLAKFRRKKEKTTQPNDYGVEEILTQQGMIIDQRIEIHPVDDIDLASIYQDQKSSSCTYERFIINTAAINNRSFLDNGRWTIIAMNHLHAPNTVFACMIDPAVQYQYDDLSRVFRYGKSKYAYNISFGIFTDSDEHTALVINSYFVKTNNYWMKRRHFEEAVTLKGKIRKVYKIAVIMLIQTYYNIIAKLTNKKGKRILFMTETKDYLVGNLESIDDRLKQRGLDQQFHISYSCRNAVGQRSSKFSWLHVVTLMARQDMILIDDYAPVLNNLQLDHKTKLIQVWHAGEGFKAVGFARFGKEGTPYPTVNCHRRYTHVLTGSKRLVRIFAEAFGIEEEAFYPVGMPRLDGFLDEKHIREFKENFYSVNPTLKNKKIILFAPTFRGKGQQSAHYDYSKIDLTRFYEYCGGEWVMLVKMHPFVKKAIEIPEQYADRIIDMTHMPNIIDMYYITDLLITDYSSNFYEYALLKRPVLFYTYDRVKYELTRGVHTSIKENAPGKVCDTFDELMEALYNEDYEYNKMLAFAKDNFEDYDGHASDRVIDQILLQDTEKYLT